MLTRVQAELLAFIEKYTDENGGVSPSFDEMQQALGLASKSGVHRLVRALEERKRIRRLPNRARSIEVLGANPLERFSMLQLKAEIVRRVEGSKRELAA